MSAASDFLQQMAAVSRQRADAARQIRSEATLLAVARATPPPLPLLPHSTRFDLIAELKLRSPAAGQLKSAGEDIHARVSGYARAGAAAVSILTEPSRFDGSMEHLVLAAQTLRSLRVPVMRKDFLVDPYQVIEARAAGAGGVLVILRMLPRQAVAEMLDCARQLGLFVLLEAFDEQDLDGLHELTSSAGPAPAVLAGLNCRDLATLQIVPQRLLDLADRLPNNVPRVAESGVLTPADASQVAGAGYEYALVGSALMQGGDPQSLAAAMLEAGRAAQGRVP